MPLRHRHIAALPIVLLLIGLSLVDGEGSRFRSVVLPVEEREIFGGEGFQTMTMGNHVLHSWSGFFFAKASAGHLSVAALTSPVLVRSDGTDPVLVPLGWQWRTGGPLARVPAHFSAEYATDIPSVPLEPVPHTFETVETWLIASIHPLLRDWAWVVRDPDGISPADRIVRVQTFPQSDTLSEAALPFTVERWGIAIRSVLETTDDPRTVLEDLVLHIVEMVQWFTAHGYPERAERYRNMLGEVTEDFHAFLSAESVRVLEHMHDIPDDAVFDPVATEREEQSQESVPLSPEDVVVVKQQAYGILRDMGALFTIHTDIVPLSVEEAHVLGIVFGNHTFDFMLNMETRTIASIVMDAAPMAYPMTVDDFRGWIE